MKIGGDPQETKRKHANNLDLLAARHGQREELGHGKGNGGDVEHDVGGGAGPADDVEVDAAGGIRSGPVPGPPGARHGPALEQQQATEDGHVGGVAGHQQVRRGAERPLREHGQVEEQDRDLGQAQAGYVEDCVEVPEL